MFLIWLFSPGRDTSLVDKYNGTEAMCCVHLQENGSRKFFEMLMSVL